MRSAPPDECLVPTSPTSVVAAGAAVRPVDLDRSLGGPSLHQVRARVETRIRDLGAGLFDRLVSEVLAGDTSGGHSPK
jgi:hypothetical protein